MRGYFITGTDTDVGKTFVASRLLAAAAIAGRPSLGYKPVAAGCYQQDGNWVNDDVLSLAAGGSVKAPLEHINPIQLIPAIAPHIAAQEAGITLSVEDIVVGYHNLQQWAPELVLMEGAGGWRLPLGNGKYLSDAVKALELPVIIVVGMRLGCLNHALLTAEAINNDGLAIHGWVANQLAPDMPYYADNLATLQQLMPAPMLAEVPYQMASTPTALEGLSQIFA